MVSPTIIGNIVERLDHVLITRFSPDLFIASTRSSKRGSAKDPFFKDLLIYGPPFDYLVRRFTMKRFDVFFFFRVFAPSAGFPQGVHGLRPIELRPSPPPCG